MPQAARVRSGPVTLCSVPGTGLVAHARFALVARRWHQRTRHRSLRSPELIEQLSSNAALLITSQVTLFGSAKRRPVSRAAFSGHRRPFQSTRSAHNTPLACCALPQVIVRAGREGARLCVEWT